MNFKFGKDKKLKGRKKIENLFHSGRKLRNYPITAVYLFSPGDFSFQVGFSVPKRLFKKAVDRNQIKRRMREAFRLNQHKLKHNGNLDIMLIYTSGKIKDYASVEKSILSLIDSLNAASNGNTES